METCVLCERIMPNSDVFSVSNLGKKTFECKDEDVCLDVATQARKEKAIKAKANRSAAFREKFGVNIDDLVELTPRLRDASVHYYDKVGDRIFTQQLWNNDGDMTLNESQQLRRMFKL
jgi:hypothetical protein